MSNGSPKLFVINGVRMDLSEYLDFKEQQEESDLAHQWGEDWSVPDDDEFDDTFNRKWDD